MMKSKKLIVPLIAIMVSVVALAGVIYAYTASVDVSDNKATGNDFTLDLKDGSGNLVVSPLSLDTNTFILTNATTIGSESKQVVINGENVTGIAYTGKLVITTDTGVHVALTADTPAAMAIQATGSTGTITLTPTLTFYKDNGAGAKGDAYTPGTDLGTGSTITVWFDVTITGSGSNTFANTTDSRTCITAVETAIAAASFSLGFDATEYTA